MTLEIITSGKQMISGKLTARTVKGLVTIPYTKNKLSNSLQKVWESKNPHPTWKIVSDNVQVLEM